MDLKNIVSSKSKSTDSVNDSSKTGYNNKAFNETELQLSQVVSEKITKNNIWKSSTKDPPENNKNINNLQRTVDSTLYEKSTENPFSPFNTRKMYLAAGVVLLFPICMGMTVTYSATATIDMAKPHSTIKPNDEEVSWIGSLVAIGALMGASAASFCTNFFGRKGALMYNTIPFVIGWCMIAYGDSLEVIYAARMVTGFCTGIVSVATPIYLVEISTPEVRGLLGSCFQLFVNVGILFIAVLGSVLTWRYSAITAAVTSLVAAALMIPMPESPKWLISKQRRGEAKNAILFLQGKEYDAEIELTSMEEEIKSQPKTSLQLNDFMAPGFYKPLICSILLVFFQQFCGISAILFFCGIIFENAKSSMDSIQATIIVSIVQVIATLVASLLMDRAGRKLLLVISSVWMAISLIAFGGFSFAKYEDQTIGENYGWVPLLCLMSYLIGFSLGSGPVTWLILPEMTSIRFRGVICSIATAVNWFFAFVVTKLYHAEEELLHDFGVYWVYSVINIIAIFFIYFLLPETKGKTIDEIQEHFVRKKVSDSKI